LPLADASNAANPYDLREGVANGTLNANGYRNYPGFSGIEQEENETNFDYNSLQAGVRFGINRHGLTTQLVLHLVSQYLRGEQRSQRALQSIQPKATTSGSDTGFDRRHIFNASYVYALPFFSKSDNLVAHEVLGGWQISGVTVAEKGVPLYVTYTGSDVTGLGGGTTNRPNLVSKVTYPKTTAAWFSTSSYADPTAPWAGGSNQGFGSAGRDSVVGPGIFNWNLSLFKSIPITSHEGPRIELRFESFNTFNHVDFQGVDTGSHDGNFGTVTNDYGPRTMELGGKFIF
jgi:hypothetical protein